MNADDPLYPHRLEILAHPATQHLILAGGFGIRLKRGYIADLVRAGQARTLIADFPEARATADLDFFLRLEAFTHSAGAEAVRDMLDTLRYQVKEGRQHWQFARLNGPLPGNRRLPRVGQVSRDTGTTDNERVRIGSVRQPA